MEYIAGKIDVAVVGAGHAGIEAALATARLGCETVLFTINLDAVGNMRHRRGSVRELLGCSRKTFMLDSR